MLAQSVAQDFNGQVRFVAENYGDSAIAKRFGVKRYPAIFVNDVLVATPKDFGFYGTGEGEGNGRYAPLLSEASHLRFRADLSRVVTLLLAGRAKDAQSLSASPDTGEVERLPEFLVTDLDGRSLTPADLAGKVVVVDFWATWCPPCRGALGWLGELKEIHGDRVVVVTLAVESDEAEVRRLATSLNLPFRWVMRTPAVLRAFGDVSAVPTMLIFDQQGRRVSAAYGSSPALHAQAGATIAALLR